MFIESEQTISEVISVAIAAVVTGGGWHLGRRMGLWTSRRRVFFFLWISFSAPLLFLSIDIGIEESWLVAGLAFLFAILIGGPFFGCVGSIWPFVADCQPKSNHPMINQNRKN